MSARAPVCCPRAAHGDGTHDLDCRGIRRPRGHVSAYDHEPAPPHLPISIWRCVLLISWLGCTPIASVMAGRAAPGTTDIRLLVAGGIGLLSGVVICLAAYAWTRSPWRGKQ